MPTTGARCCETAVKHIYGILHVGTTGANLVAVSTKPIVGKKVEGSYILGLETNNEQRIKRMQKTNV